MIQSPVQCLGCRKCEEHSNAQMLLPGPRIRQIDSNALMTSAPSVNQKHVTGLQKGSNVPYHGHFVSMKCWNLSEDTPANTLPLTINKIIPVDVEGLFFDVPTNSAQNPPKSLIRVSVHSFGAKEQG